jgi:Protein of unknown function (DUF664)
MLTITKNSFTRLAIFILLCSGIVTIAQPEIKREWTTFEQVKDASFSKKKIKFKLSASSRVILVDTTAYTQLWVRVDSKKERIGFFESALVKSEEWKTYFVEGEIDENSDQIHFGAICFGNGKFYFDDVVLMIQNEKGNMEKVIVENAGFEIPVSGNEIPDWVQGTSKNYWVKNNSSDQSVRIKGFSFSSSLENITGKLSLLVEGKGIQKDSSYYIGPIRGFSPHIGALVSMLNNLSLRVEEQVSMLNQNEMDFLLDAEANRIGALIMHLAASESFYQVKTFENRGFNEEEKKKWQVAFDLGDRARKEFVGHPVEYYINIYKQVRQKTMEELRKRNDEWLIKTDPEQLINNYYSWFHIMEHQSSHLGQILLLKKRLPKREKLLSKQKLHTDH